MWFCAAAIICPFSVAASDIKSDEVVVFYPTFAHRDQDEETWKVRIHGLICEPEPNSLRRAALVTALCRGLDLEQGSLQSELLDRRLGHFLVDNERGKEISIRLGSRVYKLDESGPNGHFGGVIRLPAAEAERLVRRERSPAGWISFEAVTRENDKRRFTGRVQLIGNSGLSLISDIDDTIKISQVTDRKALLANTFLRRFRAVPGMAELYRHAARRGAAFHYVSGSPWQLYLPLVEFCRAEGFPPGPFHLKYFRPTDSTVLSVLSSQEKTKHRAIGSVIAAFPKRRFVLVGDSGEQDPEIYGKVAREHPGKVVGIFIRNVTGESADSRRFRSALKGIEKGRGRVFRRAEELRPLLSELIEAHAAQPQP